MAIRTLVQTSTTVHFPRIRAASTTDKTDKAYVAKKRERPNNAAFLEPLKNDKLQPKWPLKSALSTKSAQNQMQFRRLLGQGLTENVTTRRRPSTSSSFLSPSSKSSYTKEFGVPDEVLLLNVGSHFPEELETYKRFRFLSPSSKSSHTKEFGVSDEVRLLNVGSHFPEELETYERFRLCSSKTNNKRSKIKLAVSTRGYSAHLSLGIYANVAAMRGFPQNASKFTSINKFEISGVRLSNFSEEDFTPAEEFQEPVVMDDAESSFTSTCFVASPVVSTSTNCTEHVPFKEVAPIPEYTNKNNNDTNKKCTWKYRAPAPSSR
ncbi:hypothetical protein J6590_092742 [Homalodisca vitripennis]|nr:hypothetical protein J6590_092742 [Homalodisca vitripennis]